ncbi:MAG: hypothetical protein WC755_02040 [Candidatus Woesearchaeota archaeon]|jgi:hypothetical protein
MEKIQHKIEELNPDKKVIVGLIIAASETLTGKVNNTLFDIVPQKEGEPTELLAPPVFLSGEYDIVRAKLHEIIDNVLEASQCMSEQKEHINKLKSSTIRQEQGKPIIWNPGGN